MSTSAEAFFHAHFHPLWPVCLISIWCRFVFVTRTFIIEWYVCACACVCFKGIVGLLMALVIMTSPDTQRPLLSIHTIPSLQSAT